MISNALMHYFFCFIEQYFYDIMSMNGYDINEIFRKIRD